MKWLVIGVFALGLLLAAKDMITPLLPSTPATLKAGAPIAAADGDPAYRLPPLTATQNEILRQAGTLGVAGIRAYSAGRYGDMEQYLQQALSLVRRVLPADHPDIASTIVNLANAIGQQGRHAEAERLLREALASMRRVLPADHPDIAATMSNLAGTISDQGRRAEAELLYREVLEFRRRVLPAGHRDIASTMSNLAGAIYGRGRDAEAERLLGEALASMRRVLPADHPDIAMTMRNLANPIGQQGRHAEAERLLREALASMRRVLPADHPDIASTMSNLATRVGQQGHHAEAERLLREALASMRRALPADHPDTATAVDNLVVTLVTQDKVFDAVAATEGMFTASDGVNGDIPRLQALVGHLLLELSKRGLTGLTTVQRSQTESRLLELVQAATPSLIGRTADHLAARLGAGDAGLADLLRQRQEARDRARELAAQHLFLLQRGQPEAKATKQELEASEQRAAALQERLGQTYPGYRDLEGGGRVSLAELQAVLQPGEVVLLQVAGEDGLGLMAIRKDRVVLGYAPVGRERLAKLVEVVRSGLEHPAEGFQSDAAAELYQAVVAPVAAALDKVTHVLVQPDGALRSLPLEVLVVGKGAGVVTELPRDRKKLSELKWFGLSYAVSVIPSLRFLVSNRQDARPASRGGPLLGIGDPIVSGNPECAKSPLVSTLEKVAVTPGTRLADVTALRRECPLPGTRQELEAISKGWEAPKGSLNRLLLGPEATERQVKEMSRSGDLARFASVVFSTHGYLPQEASEAAAAGKRPRLDSDMRLTRPAVAANPGRMPEPGLLLTPPAQASEEDDGYLSLSEIAALKLGPAVVTLAACNTGGQGEAGAESLSGLAKAFYHAGARTVLVTHWDVQTKAVGEVNRLVHEHASKPGSGWAGALLAARREQAMSRPYPAYWAVFSLIGDGAMAPTK